MKLKFKLPVLRTENLVIQVFVKGEDSVLLKVDILKPNVFRKLKSDYLSIEAVSILNIFSPLNNEKI